MYRKILEQCAIPYKTKFWREKILVNEPSAIIGGKCMGEYSL